MHGLSDEHSDVDIVLLIEGKRFEAFTSSVESYLYQISDEVLLCWPEDFSSELIINNGYLLLKADRIFQFDIFLLNSVLMEYRGWQMVSNASTYLKFYERHLCSIVAMTKARDSFILCRDIYIFFNA